MRSDLPTGTVTFLFTDVEGSTRLLHEFGAEGYADALAEHRRVIREACAREGGVEVDTQGDAFFFAFPTAPGAVTAASSMTEALASGPIRVRVGLHTGTPLLADEGYVGDAVHFAARVASSGHGGQVVCSKATADLVELDLTDLGEHRLKDIAEAVPIYQLGDGSFPPLKTISNTNLPRPASSFVGRKQELETVLALIEEGARLLTLTGPGGSGKTRLALEAASTLVPEYKAGVFWVGLAALRDPALVTETIAQTLGSKDGLAEHIGERELLLLLDNLEQVIEVAPELSSLLQGCPNLTLLVTSRELLRVQGELEYEVPPLLEPEAVSLFCVRSQLEPSEEISELCRRLDSLPLAVELAAARTKALSPKQILERLSQRLDLLKGGRDADPRQQTLRATIEWSYDLLSADEQELFARLSVFSGGCTLEAAEQVADADLNTLQSLVEKSLLRFTDERYWMLETIREFAEERVRSGDLAARCDDYFVGVASRANVESSSGQGDWLDRLEEERANLRNSISSSLARNAVESAYQLATAYARLTVMRGPRGDGRHCLTQVLQHQDEASAEARQQALLLASILAERQNDLEAARSYAEESLGLARSGGDPDAVGSTLLSLGIVAGDAGDLERSEALQVEALTMFSEAGNARRVRQTLGMLAFLYIARGDYPRAADVAREALDLSRASGDSWGMTVAAGNLGHAMMRMGHLEEARGLMRDALLGAHAMRDVQAFSETLLDFATLAMSADHRPRDAATLLGAIDGFSESAEFALVSVEIQWFGELREQARGALGEQEFSRAMDAGRRMSMDEVLNLALASRD